MKNRYVSTKRPIWKKLVGIGIVTSVIFAIVAGVQYTVAWAGSGYDYNGNEVRRALPVAASGKTASGSSNAQVVIADNTKSSQPSSNTENQQPNSTGSTNNQQPESNNQQPGTSNPNNQTAGNAEKTSYVPANTPPAVNAASTANSQYPQTSDAVNIWLPVIGMFLVLDSGIAVFHKTVKL